MNYLFLSHIYTEVQPAYGGLVELGIKKIKAISRGDSSNVFQITLENHWGTHIDAPNHFFEKGKKITDYQAEFFVFKHPQILGVSIEPGGILGIDDLSGKVAEKTDLLLFSSGWSDKRDDSLYGIKNPGIHPDVAFYLRGHFPKLRAIGIDWVSISSYSDRELGRAAHKAFLDPDGMNDPILLIEDLNLPSRLDALREVWVIPLRIEGIDSAPCTVVGVLD